MISAQFCLRRFQFACGSPAQGATCARGLHKGRPVQGVSVDLSMSAVKDRIDDLSMRVEALELCRSQNLLRKQHISSKYVVVHPRNRYGDGIVPGQVLTLVDAFANHGFSWLEIG